MSPAPQRPFLPDEDFRALKRRLVERTGHHYYEDKDDILWDRLRRRLEAVGAKGVTAYLAHLDGPGGEAEWAELESEITIGETFFFRYAEQFEALRKIVLPALIEARGESRRLRIWSAGCSNGAEPFSIAILLDELLGEALPSWRVSILGSDIDEAALARARTGRFNSWALRTLEAEARERWFRTEAPGQFLLKPQYRAMVRFQRQNLMQLLDGTAAIELDEFDLILCRNVLIYFRHDTAVALAGALGRRLNPDGWLFVGHAEPNPDFAEVLDPAPLPGTAAYRPKGSEPQKAETPAWAPEAGPPQPAPAPADSAPEPRRAWTSLLVQPSTPSPAASDAADAGNRIEEIRRLADLGDAAGALALSLRAAAADRPDPEVFLYRGLALRALGREAEAEAALRRALFLDRDFAAAWQQLAMLLKDTGRDAAAGRALASAVKALGTLTDDVRLRAGDGMTAGDLRAFARLQIAAWSKGRR